MEYNIRSALLFILIMTLSACSFNPLRTDNHTTGSAGGAAIGAGVGAGTVAVFNGSKAAMALGGVGGALAGYYVTTLRFASGGILQSGGQVFTLGDYASIEIPTDRLFDANSTEFLDDAAPILDSTVAVLKRYPDNNIMISGNTSGFGTVKRERKLSEERARQVAAYLWAHGIGNFQSQSLKTRKLIYTGYGNYFPIANHIRNDSIRQNSRIQITAYPTSAQLHLDKRHKIFDNIGALNASPLKKEAEQSNYGNQFSEVLNEESSSRRNDFKDVINEGPMDNTVSPAPPQHTDYYKERPDLKEEENYNNAANASQTTEGGNVVKHGGYKGEEDFKGESPR